MDMKIGKPLGDRVLIKMIDRGDKKSSSGLIIRESADSVKRANVVAVSDGYVINTGHSVNLTVKEGDVVLVPTGISSTKLKIENETYELVRESDILMIV